ncbi:hypothetical protein CO676_10315 [Sinorhizobium sp. BJ1]|nr:hypothetical protein CO676_10315 [Sinorhizobium sp. BJ1]
MSITIFVQNQSVLIAECRFKRQFWPMVLNSLLLAERAFLGHACTNRKNFLYRRRICWHAPASTGFKPLRGAWLAPLSKHAWLA